MGLDPRESRPLSSGPSKPWRQPLTICSTQNSTISTPEIGTLAV
jgi:hypothetical protein